MANIVPALTWLENERVWVWVWQAHSACKRAKMKGGRARQTEKKKKICPDARSYPAVDPRSALGSRQPSPEE